MEGNSSAARSLILFPLQINLKLTNIMFLVQIKLYSFKKIITDGGGDWGSSWEERRDLYKSVQPNTVYSYETKNIVNYDHFGANKITFLKDSNKSRRKRNMVLVEGEKEICTGVCNPTMLLLKGIKALYVNSYCNKNKTHTHAHT